MQMKIWAVMAVLMAFGLGGCASVPSANIVTLSGKPAGSTPPAPATSLTSIPKGQYSHHYMVNLYPGVDRDFNPNPTLTLEEYNILQQLDWQCARWAAGLKGEYAEMFKQGITYGGLEGLFGTMGAVSGFGASVSANQYFPYIAGTAFGGGLGSGKIAFNEALAMTQGYCMTGMVYKADEDGALRRVFITPLFTGKAPLPLPQQGEKKQSGTSLQHDHSHFVAPPPAVTPF